MLSFLLCLQIQSGQTTKVLLANCLVHLGGERGGEERGGEESGGEEKGRKGKLSTAENS